MQLAVGIDPSTTSTGLVILNGLSGEVVFAGAFKFDPKTDKRQGLSRALAIQLQVWHEMAKAGCFIKANTVKAAIEGYGFASPKLMPSVEIGTLLRTRLYDARIPYLEPAPNQVKKFAGMQLGKVGAPKPKGKKAKPIAEVKALWQFEHPTHDVIDAFVLAKIAQSRLGTFLLTEYQRDVILACRQGPAL